MTTDLVHCASALCAASAETAFTYVATPARLGEWALGCWQAVEGEGGIVSGTSLFDGATTFARPVADPRLRIVDFEVGGDPSDSRPQDLRAGRARARRSGEAPTRASLS